MEKKKKRKIKTSYGIALCKYKKYEELEILHIKKRHTYQYFSFVMGFYKNNMFVKENIDYLRYLLKNMTYKEKLNILSMQFSQIWYHIWLNNPEINYNITDIYKNQIISIDDNKKNYKNYLGKKRIFEKNFLYNQNNQKLLIDLINETNTVNTIWEIPKGQINKNETLLDCAIREFKEETNIDISKYHIISYKPVIYTYIDENITYRNIYYLCQADCDLIPKISFKSYKQISEIEDIKWMKLQELYKENISPKMKNISIKLFKKIKKEFKKYL